MLPGTVATGCRQQLYNFFYSDLGCNIDFSMLPSCLFYGGGDKHDQYRFAIEGEKGTYLPGGAIKIETKM